MTDSHPYGSLLSSFSYVYASFFGAESASYSELPVNRLEIDMSGNNAHATLHF